VAQPARGAAAELTRSVLQQPGPHAACRRRASGFCAGGVRLPGPLCSGALAGLGFAGTGCMLSAMGKRENTGRKQAEARAEAGKFAPGVSGNPAGRPKGARNRATMLAQELLDDDGEAIMRKAIEQAKAGEPVALRLCIERILPRRANVVELILPEIRKANDVADACAAVIEAAAAGRISLQEAREFMLLLSDQRKAIETHDLAVRIEMLEGGGR
jgi:hypothetical protein